jgi:hypothetical protein
MTAELRFLTDEQVRLAAAVLDVIIPPDGEQPGAGGAGGAERLDAILAERSDVRRPVLDALRAIDIAAGPRGFLACDPATRPDILRTVEAAQPEAFTALVRQTYNAHYTCPNVRRALGFTPENPQPEGFTQARPFDPALLEGVRRRNRTWRRV